MFGNLKSVDWIWKIKLSKSRQIDISLCFSQMSVEYNYPEDVSDFNIIIESFQRETVDEKDKTDFDIMGEKSKFDKLIVMDDVSGLADKSNKFSSFLTVCRKFGYICLYIFHILFPNKTNWQMILSQTKIFNIFSLPIQLTQMLKVLTNNCDRGTINYIPARDLWHIEFFNIRRLKILLPWKFKPCEEENECRKQL